MGNFLVLKESFIWTDTENDKGSLLENFVNVIHKARDSNDEIYRTSDLFDLNTNWGETFRFLWNEGLQYDTFKIKYSWITPDQFQQLINITYLLGDETPDASTDFTSFNEEFSNQNNSWIGTAQKDFIEPLVYDIQTWRDFHQKYVSNFSFQERCDFFDYFFDHFKPSLREDLNQINTSISRKQTHPTFKQIHQPKIPHEKIHIHFNTKTNCALNLDGTWKHEIIGFVIEKEACEILSRWGFLLPIEYYRQ